MNHVPVTKGTAPFEHYETLRYSALTTQPVARARTTCTATPGIRPTASLAALWVTAIGMVQIPLAVIVIPLVHSLRTRIKL